MAYPNDRYPSSPDFPTPSTGIAFDIDFITVAAAYVSDLTSNMSDISTDDGNLRLASGKTISWTGGSDTISASGSPLSLQFSELEILDGALTNLTTVDLDVSNDAIIKSGDLVYVGGDVTVNAVTRRDETSVSVTTATIEQYPEPDDPTTDDEAKIWSDDGTDNIVGDLMAKVRHDGATKTVRLLIFNSV